MTAVAHAQPMVSYTHGTGANGWSQALLRSNNGAGDRQASGQQGSRVRMVQELMDGITPYYGQPTEQEGSKLRGSRAVRHARYWSYNGWNQVFLWPCNGAAGQRALRQQGSKAAISNPELGGRKLGPGCEEPFP